MSALNPFFVFWRTTVTRDREIVDAVVQPAHRGPSVELRTALRQWPGVHYWEDSDNARRLVLIRPLARPQRERWWLHAGLFVVTFLTVWMGGALLAGSNPGLPVPSDGLRGLGTSLGAWFQSLRPGLEFAMGLMAILLAHETGHYVTAKRYGINVSPPYFLPAPPFLNFVGTFGAFIRLRSPVVDRRQLLDVGAAGPWAGFLVAMVALVAGLTHSEVVPDAAVSGSFVMIGDLRLHLGDSPIMRLARLIMVGDGPLLLHPLAFAGWLGLFVTMLNLMPLGQLDGGHVLYALIGRRQTRVSRIAWFGLVGLGFLSAQHGWWYGLLWWAWAGLILLLSRGRLAHPQVLDSHRRLPGSRSAVGWATLLLFVGTFAPVPLYFTDM